MSVLLIGERPGLTSPDSLSIYLTWDPRPGRTDAERNCISNVRTEGIGYDLAVHKLHFLMRASRTLAPLRSRTQRGRCDRPDIGQTRSTDDQCSGGAVTPDPGKALREESGWRLAGEGNL